MLGRERMEKYWLPWLVGMPAETALSICSMIFGGVFERLPDLRVAFAHGGVIVTQAPYTLFLKDTDGDDVPDYLDSDSDGDGVTDDAWVIVIHEEDKGLGRFGFLNTEPWDGNLESTGVPCGAQ